jgi:N4-gp56 family major capsid protein
MPSYNDTNLYGDITKQQGVYAEAKMLEHAAPVLVLARMGDVKPMPKNKSEKINFRRPRTIPNATTPLTEGVTPDGSSFDYDIVEATLQEYGDWFPLSNKVTDLHEHPIGADLSMMAGEQAASTIEEITWGIVRSGTSRMLANGSARSDVTAELTLPLLRKAVKELKRNKAKRLTKILDGSPKYSTRPIEPAYVAVCHTDVEYQIRNLAGFTSTAEYGQRTLLCEEEFGACENVRFVTSPDLTSVADAGGAIGTGDDELVSACGTSADVYPIIVMGANAYGTIALKGQGAIKPMVKNPGTADSGDPMGRLGSVAWKTWYTSKILNDDWMFRIEVAAKVNPQ